MGYDQGMLSASAQHATSFYPPPAAGAAPVFCDRRIPDELRGIEAEAGAIRTALASASRDQTRRLLTQLKALSARMPVYSGRRARRSAGVIQAAITQAEQQLECLSDDEGQRLHDAHASPAFERHVYHAMSRRAKHFYDTIDGRSTYRLAPVSEGGQVLETVRRDVQGNELRKDFSLLKYHSMSEDRKREVLTRSFGTADHGEPVAADTAVLRREREELAPLRRALRMMEAYKAFTSMLRARGSVNRVMTAIASDHDHFARAHAQADALAAAYDRLLEDPRDEDAQMQLARVRARMKKTLKDDIIEGVLLDADMYGQGPGLGSLTPVPTPPALTPVFPACEEARPSAPRGPYRRGVCME